MGVSFLPIAQQVMPMSGHSKAAPTAASAATPAEHPMDQIPVRQMKFRFADSAATDSGSSDSGSPDESSQPPVWSRTSPDFAIFINALGIHVPHFERFLVKVMRTYRDELPTTLPADLNQPQLRDEVQAIIGQEAHHAFNFLGWTKVLGKHYPGVMALDAHAKTYFDGVFKRRDKKFLIGFTAGYETFTFLGGLIILNRYKELMADADPTLRALWVWHQVEEVEHGAVAFDFFRAFYPDALWYRRWMVVRAFGHIAWETRQAFALMIRREGFYSQPGRALQAWKFFAGFAFDMARAAWPVLARDYHPRNHPICNDEQSQIAVAWRKYHAAGHNTLQLNNAAIEQMLAGAS
jgi:predicted metal-dependent hydrolase